MVCVCQSELKARQTKSWMFSYWWYSLCLNLWLLSNSSEELPSQILCLTVCKLSTETLRRHPPQNMKRQAKVLSVADWKMLHPENTLLKGGLWKYVGKTKLNGKPSRKRWVCLNTKPHLHYKIMIIILTSSIPIGSCTFSARALVIMCFWTRL